MRSTRRLRFGLAAGVALALIAAGCGSDSKSSSETTAAGSGGSTAAAAGGGSEEVRLAVNPWTGSAVNANIAKAVIEEAGIGKVDPLEIRENAMWAAIAKGGTLDGVLEIWPSGHAKDYETYITGKKGIVDGGLLGPDAKIGWYVPQFVVDEHPELATWEGFKDPKLAELFKPPESGAE